MEMFPKRVTPPGEEPQAGPSGGAPEEGIVVMGGDSSVYGITPEDLGVGQGGCGGGRQCRS